MQCCRVPAFALFAVSCAVVSSQDAKQTVQQAVQTELAADDADHTRWSYFDYDQKPNLVVEQWVAETEKGDLKRVIEENGRKLSENEQRTRIDGFRQNVSAQARQRKDDQHDDQQTRQMLNMLPQAFLWKQEGGENGKTVLHFTPNPRFRPSNYQERVFAAMRGDMTVDSAQHRIVGLRGQLAHDVKFGGGLFGNLRAGGSFDIERREIANGEWQIVETHVHIAGRILFFKNIADQEDDWKSRFKELPTGISMVQAERLLLARNK